jgi:HD-GYP domain-containing protein (c-di-GMP phosphodiesterase class II)
LGHIVLDPRHVDRRDGKDVFDALTTDKPYRPALRPEEAIAWIREQSNRSFDAAVVDAFAAVIAEPDFQAKLSQRN